MKHLNLLLYLCLLFPTHHAYANWQRSVTNHSRHTYKAANQNWMVEQHENGWMYFANNKGLLEFDGVTWNTYSIHNAKTRAVKSDGKGKIYVGGLGQFGYFEPTRQGNLEYVCLSDSLPSGVNAGNIWNIHIVEDGVYFQSDRSVFYLENNEIKEVNHGVDIMNSAVINKKFYIASELGLSILNGDEFSLLPHTRDKFQSKIVGLYPFGDDIIIVSSQNGIFIYNSKEIVPYPSAADSFLKENQLFCSAQKDSLIALGSVQDGVMILNTHNGGVEKISLHNGLQNKTVLSVLFDRENNLWLGLDNGIDCINLNAPMFFLYSSKSAIGSGYSSCYYNGKLYLGTNQGLYVTDYPLLLNEEAKLNFVPGTEGQVWSVTKFDNKLFCGGGNSLIILDGDKISRLPGIRGVWAVAPLRHYPDHLIAGTYGGLFIIKKKNGEWTLSHRIVGPGYSAKTMYVEEMSKAVWLANKEKGLYRMILAEDLQSAQIKNYNDENLPAGNNVYVTKINDEIVIASRQGLFRYNQIKDKLEKYTELEDILDGNVPYTHIRQDEHKDIWYVTDGMLKLARYQKETNTFEKTESESYLRGFLIEDFEHISIYEANQALIGTEEGFCLLDFSQKPQRKFPLNLQIRKVYLTIGKDSLVYGRSITYDPEPLVIPYKNNSIKIEYSVNNYDKSLVTLYAYKLEGNDSKEWSEYSENHIKEFTNLKEGKYTFYVKIITNKEKEPITTSFDFEVLPPWYRTWWAYLSYLILVLAVITFTYYKISENQKRIIKRKNQEIIQQKVKFKEESAKKDQKIDSLKEKNLQTDLKHKSDELVKTTMNIVRKNEMLQAIRKEAVSISRSIEEENLPTIRRKMIRLISHIDTNIEHDDDLNAFQTSFDSLHQDFFEKLDKLLPGLNKKDKLLCAYIKMDLMSKEIAPLLNISLRGVEISRYRLRKKLQLSTEDNLAEFLQRL